jgi:hypothetical protein
MPRHDGAKRRGRTQKKWEQSKNGEEERGGGKVNSMHIRRRGKKQ